ncbi:multiple epidermal growth factor-like domains 10 [Elysia marginata]|uniref:Multiple epidermal growth factor-like domains 10 n=1 Tax=Elysia marginata TaxID=1093978 RepID=A0AAV4FZK0_9GAST|nr:multiple epidermal growth factor-like domains 10 [Elysia marginata]
MNGTYGEDCTYNCSEHCQGSGKLCHHVTGVCLQACQAGSSGDLYDTPSNNSYRASDLETCSVTCKETSNQSRCDPLNGTCTSGCIAGYQGDFCEEVCSNGTYGENCARSCRMFCNGTGEICHPVNGSCYYGCRDGYEGEMCNILNTLLTDEEEEEKRRWVFGVLTIGFIIVVCVILLAIVFTMGLGKAPQLYEDTDSDTDDSDSEETEPRPAREPSEQSLSFYEAISQNMDSFAHRAARVLNTGSAVDLASFSQDSTEDAVHFDLETYSSDDSVDGY